MTFWISKDEISDLPCLAKGAIKFWSGRPQKDGYGMWVTAWGAQIQLGFPEQHPVHFFTGPNIQDLLRVGRRLKPGQARKVLGVSLALAPPINEPIPRPSSWPIT